MTRRPFSRYKDDEPDDDAATADLVERAKRGEGDAWERLYQRIQPRLLAYASRRLDRETARDAVAETMSRAVASIDRFRWRGASFDAWLFGILRHVVIDAQRAAGRPPALEAEGTAPVEPLDIVLAGEEAAAVRAAFGRLSPDERELLELRVVARLSAEEAAAVLGKRPGAVRMAQSRALARLRHLMEDRCR